MLKLHSFPFSPNHIKVAAVLHHLGLEFETVVVDLTKGASFEPGYKALNPNAMIPTLEDGDFKLWESTAIITYLAEKHGSELMPRDVRQRAEVNQWLCWQLCHWMPALGTIAFERLAPNFFPGHKTDEAAVEKALTNLKRFAPVLDAQLAGRPYVAGDRLSLADFALAASAFHRQASQTPLEDYPNIQAWLARIESLPAWKKAQPAAPAGV